MEGSTFFYKYQSLKPEKDKDENYRIYALENLANKQFFFKHPDQFNDPFDCNLCVVDKGTEKQWINFFVNYQGYTRTQPKKEFKKECDDGFLVENEDGLYYRDIMGLINRSLKLSRKYKKYNLIRKSMEKILKSEGSPSVCCFSLSGENILMWSHYADYHKGICLRFRSHKKTFEIGEPSLDFYFLDNKIEHNILKLHSETINEYVDGLFVEVSYEPAIPDSVGFLDLLDELEYFIRTYVDETATESTFNPKGKLQRLFKFLYTKFKAWEYEQEYRIFLTNNYLDNGLINYDESDLDGIIFGWKISSDYAKEVYTTIKKNYKKEGAAVNFYKSEEVPREYKVKCSKIDNVETYLEQLKSYEESTDLNIKVTTKFI